MSYSVCVFCSASSDIDERYMALAREMGQLGGERGWRMIYGGSRAGSMGVMADAALLSGAQVIGVIPGFLQDREVYHEGLSELHITETMHERQMKMSDLADAFVILPGGLGTMAEFLEVITWRLLNLHKKPIYLINFEGYWDPLIDMIESVQDQKFLHRVAAAQLFTVLEDLQDLPKNIGENNILSAC